MDMQYTGERFGTLHADQETDKDINSTTINSSLIIDNIPLDTSQETNILNNQGEVVENSMIEPVTDNIPFGKNILIVDSMDELITSQAPMKEVNPPEPSLITNAGSLAELLNREDSTTLRAHWNEIQTKFIDDPRSAVQQADGLVSEVVEKITLLFSDERKTLEGQWKQGNDVSTEDLRKALQHYRSFFNRLVV